MSDQLAIESKQMWIKMIGRLGRETQLHIDERYRHFKITDGVILAVSLVLAILAVVNVYYVYILYKDLNGIVSNMDSMHTNLIEIKDDMISISTKVHSFDQHMLNMDDISSDMVSMTTSVTDIRESMGSINGNIGVINTDMKLLGDGMGNIDFRLQNMTGTVSTMRYYIHDIARPMRMMP